MQKRKRYEIQAVQAATLNLKQQTHKLRFLHLLTYMRQQDTPQTVKVFEDEFIKILNEEKEVEQHNQHNKTSRQAAYNATTSRGAGKDKHSKQTCTYCDKKGHTESTCYKKQREEGGEEGNNKGKRQMKRQMKRQR